MSCLDSVSRASKVLDRFILGISTFLGLPIASLLAPIPALEVGNVGAKRALVTDPLAGSDKGSQKEID